MAAILIFGAFLLTAISLLCRKGIGLQESILKAALAVLVVKAVSTEMLSFFNALALRPVFLLWLFINLLSLAALAFLVTRPGNFKRVVRKFQGLTSLTDMSGRSVAFATLTLVIILLTFVMAALQHPYDADSISYHMPRVAHWINQGHVGFYATVNQRQNFFAPLSSYAVLHLQLLSGTDLLSIVPQYGGMLLSLMLVAKISYRLGLGATGQWFAVAVSSSIPMLIAQSHCQQNELVLAALLLGFAWLLMQVCRRPGPTAALWCGSAFGLALLTKGTAFFYCAAIGAAIGGHGLLSFRANPKSVARLSACLAVVIVTGLLFNLPFFYRCRRSGRGFLDNEHTVETRNERIGLDIMSANAVRNLAMHFWLPSDEWNSKIETVVREKIGEQEANPESTFRGLRFRLHPKISCFYVNSPFHLMAALAALVFLPLVKTKKTPRSLLAAWALAVILAAVLFNLLLKWQYWGMRLQLPWMLMTVPVVAVVFFRSRLPRGMLAAAQICAVVLFFMAAIPALVMDEDIPLWSTTRPPLFLRDAESVRFGSREPKLRGETPQERAVEFLKEADPCEVGLMVPRCNASRDYNWWVVFGNNARPGRPLLRHVAPEAWPEPSRPPPEFVIADRRTPRGGIIMDVPYEPVHSEGRIRIYRRMDR